MSERQWDWCCKALAIVDAVFGHDLPVYEAARRAIPEEDLRDVLGVMAGFVVGLLRGGLPTPEHALEQLHIGALLSADDEWLDEHERED